MCGSEVVGDAEVDQREPPTAGGARSRRGVACQASRSNSGGGVGATTARLGWIRTPAALTCVERALGVEVADVVRGVARGGEALEPEHLGRRRRGRSPPARAASSPQSGRTRRRRGGARCARARFGVDEVRCPDLETCTCSPGCSRTSVRLRRRGRGGCARAAGAAGRAARARARRGRFFSSGTQVAGPQSKSAGPSDVSTT